MDEAESLADNIVIMKAGEFISYGTVSALKLEHSNGLYIDLQMENPTSAIKQLYEQLNLDQNSLLKESQIHELMDKVFENKYKWTELCKFGNGKIINDQLQNLGNNHSSNENENEEENSYKTVSNSDTLNDDKNQIETNIVLEYFAIIQQINHILKVVKSEFKGVELVCENIGLLLKINLQGVDLSCGRVFQFLDTNKEQLRIS
mmetsp:Transcript_72009/g.155548  ORF Transcript_72009/g.155548 Transcript_72009/m.155548 type:complete len:204 (+) Transcript_72009:87-698(+)